MNMHKSKLPSLLLLLIFGGIFAWYLTVHSDDFGILADLKVKFIAVIVFGHISTILLNAYFIKKVLVPFGKNISVNDSVFVSLISSIGNFFLPLQSGAGIRAVYLKRKYKLSYDKFLPILSGTYAINFFLNSLLGLVTLYFLQNQTDLFEGATIGVIFLSLFIFSGLLIFSKFGIRVIQLVTKLSHNIKLQRISSNIIEGWNVIVSNSSLLKNLILITMMSILANYVIFSAELASLGLHTSVWSILFYSSIGALIIIVNITPASLGIREAVLVFSMSALGLSVSEILSLAIIDRVIKFSVLGISWLVLYLKAGFTFNSYMKSNDEG